MSTASAHEPTPLGPGRRIGRYRLVRRIGAGGMGTVYEAEQDEPRRTVALKVLARSEDPDALARFKYEAQVLAQLSHPGIAQVYEAGVERELEGDVVRELPWFAMEHVAGARTLLEHAEAEGLDLRARLALFVQVADAVHHGHQRGVIHRDLKPGNILVDAAGRPKVIDFGIARIVGAEAPQRSLRTSTGQVLGTLRYMSPEQVSGHGARERVPIDSRSDVFALGLVLFELAARRPAYALETLSLTEAVELVARARLPALREVDRDLPRELQWIVERACALERERRYPSVSELAADVERLLAGEPVAAAPADTLYRMRVFVRRHRIGVGTAVLVLASLGLAVFVLARGLRTERRLLAAERAERRRAAGNAAFLSEMLSSVSPAREGHDVRMLDVLDRAVPRIAERYADQPLLRADLDFAIGAAYQSLTRNEPAVAHARSALAIREELLGPDDPATGAARGLLGLALRGAGELAEAEPLLRQRLAEVERERGAADPGARRVRATLVDLLIDGGREDEGRALLEEALGGESPETIPLDEGSILLVDRLMRLEVLAGRPEALEGWVARLEREEADVPDELRAMLGDALLNRGIALASAGRLEEARAAFAEGIRKAESAFGPGGGTTIKLRTNLANVDLLRGDGAAALQTMEQALADAERSFGTDHPAALDVRYTWCGALWSAGERERAAEELEELVLRGRRTWPAGNEGLAEWAGTLGRMRVSLGRPAEGEPFLRESVDALAAARGDAHPSTQLSLRWLVRALEESGRSAEAEALRPRVLRTPP